MGKTCSLVRQVIRCEVWAFGHNAVRVDGVVAVVVVLADVPEIHRVADARMLTEVAVVAEEVGKIDNAVAVALEMLCPSYTSDAADE